MLTALLPANEPERLVALAPYRVLGTQPDAVFDELVRLTAKLLEVPIALVSLVDEGSVWFKARFGLAGAPAVARDESICSVAILQQETTIYRDLQAEPCQLVKPAVTAALQLRFYAAHPLRSAQGQPLGALCVLDHHPRALSAQEQHILATLAELVMQLLDIRLALPAQPAQTLPVWTTLYDHLDAALARLDSLAARSRQEATSPTAAARYYQHAREAEITGVTSELAQQAAQSLATLRASWEQP